VHSRFESIPVLHLELASVMLWCTQALVLSTSASLHMNACTNVDVGVVSTLVILDACPDVFLLFRTVNTG